MNWRENETIEDAAARLLAGLVEREKRKASERLKASEKFEGGKPGRYSENGKDDGPQRFERVVWLATDHAAFLSERRSLRRWIPSASI